MSDFNIVIIKGRLTRDPEVRYLPKGTALATLGVAVTRSWKQGDDWKEETAFIDCDVWAKRAEACGQELHKGSIVTIKGYLKLDQWDDKQSGQKRSKLKVVAEDIDWHKAATDGQPRSERPASRPAAPKPAEEDQSGGDGSGEIPF